jgi:hypothetical protein
LESPTPLFSPSSILPTTLFFFWVLPNFFILEILMAAQGKPTYCCWRSSNLELNDVAQILLPDPSLSLQI